MTLGYFIHKSEVGLSGLHMAESSRAIRLGVMAAQGFLVPLV